MMIDNWRDSRCHKAPYFCISPLHLDALLLRQLVPADQVCTWAKGRALGCGGREEGREVGQKRLEEVCVLSGPGGVSCTRRSMRNSSSPLLELCGVWSLGLRWVGGIRDGLGLDGLSSGQEGREQGDSGL